jgi:hypothetical protein
VINNSAYQWLKQWTELGGEWEYESILDAESLLMNCVASLPNRYKTFREDMLKLLRAIETGDTHEL